MSASTQRIPEITLKVIILSIILTVLLAASNTYLALKVGLLTSASIPAAILSMGILRFFKRASILENNCVQTCASAGEAVAGGIVYPLPALLMLHFWGHVPYWETFFISIISGTLGVMFSVPVRRLLLNDPQLRFPEGRAIAELLLSQQHHAHRLFAILTGGLLGAIIEFAQSGLKILAQEWQLWVVKNHTIIGGGIGFSSTLIGAGYLIGFNLGLSIIIGTILSWLIAIPIASHYYAFTPDADLTTQVMTLWTKHIRFIGLGTLIVAGMWTLLTLARKIFTLKHYTMKTSTTTTRLQTERDFSLRWVCGVILLLCIFLFFLFNAQLPLPLIGLPSSWHIPFIVGAIIYVLIAGFMITTICGYFSGMVGVSATPGSAVIITGMIGIAVLIRLIVPFNGENAEQYTHFAAATTIMIGSIIAGATAITNDNIQDLKVGQLVGATPWKQQVMLLLGVLIASIVIPPIMQILIDVYGLAGFLPRPGMDPSHVLPAPAATMFATLAQAIFNGQIEWVMLLIGTAIGIASILLNGVLKRWDKSFSPIGIATGMYLPLTTSTPLFIGALLAFVFEQRLARKPISQDQIENKLQNRSAVACGLVAGSAIINVILAIPFALTENTDVLRILPNVFTSNVTAILGTVVIIGLCLYLVSSREKKM